MHELEQFDTDTGGVVTAFAFTGGREDIWHRLGQSLDGRSMTAEEAMRQAHMNRQIRILPVPAPEGAHWAIPERYFVILDGDVFVTPEGEFVTIPDKVVGEHGKGGADAHEHFSVYDRFALAEAAIHASEGEAVWSTAGSLRDGTQGFACMEAPDIVIDPEGIADRIRQYLTLVWSFDGTKATELGSSEIRVVCANTLTMHDHLKNVVIKVKHTSHTAESRFRLAADQWAIAQDKAAALKLMAERMLRVRDSRLVLGKLIEKFDPVHEGASKRQVTLRQGRLDRLEVLSASSTNTMAGDTGWAAFNTFVEYLDWESPVKCAEGETEGDRRLGNQFDGTYDELKSKAADLVLSMS